MTDANRHKHTTGTSQDITARKVAEEELAAYAERLERLHAEEREQRQLAEALQDAGRALSSTLDVDTIWDRLLDHIGRVVPFDSASVMSVEGEYVSVTRLRGYREVGGEALARQVKALRLSIAETSNLRRMVESGRALVVPDTAAVPDWISAPDLGHIRSWAGAPIQIHGVTVAFFSVDKTEPNFYRPAHARILEAFAGTVSLALQNAHLFEQTQRRVGELSALYQAGTSLTQLSEPAAVGERILATLETFMDFRQAGVVLRGDDDSLQILAYKGTAAGTEPDVREKRAQQAAQAEESVVRWVIEHGQVLRLGNVAADPRYVEVDPAVQSELCVPLQVGERTIGAINVETDVANAFDGHDERLLQTMAAQAAVALENARLFTAEQETRQQLARLAQYLQAVREKERTRIAREVHDEFGQALTALNMDVSWLAHRLPADQPALSAKVEEMAGLVKESIHMVRHIASELRPGLLDDLGLVAALEWQLQEFSRRYGVETELSVAEEPQLERPVATTLFRICQEGLTNVARHARASRVAVSLAQVGDELVLTVGDNGRGITAEEIQNRDSLGLVGMAERAHTLGGTFAVTGEPGEGTTLTVRVPLPANEGGEA